jgi:hypothetical protein
MPPDALQPGDLNDFAMFQIGRDGEKLNRIVLDGRGPLSSWSVGGA